MALTSTGPIGFNAAAPPLPDSTAISFGPPPAGGTYRPTNYGAGDPFPPPAPSASFGASLSVFNGSNPNGTWRLYINDDAVGEQGQLDAWSVTITSAPDPGRCSNPFTLTNRDDVFFGGRGGDRVFARGGNDTMRTFGGDDCVSAGSGRDLVRGADGDDQISGNSGNDRLTGNRGNDRLWGNSGRGGISARSGNDRISGGRGGDTISGGPGRDRISGNSGNDTIRANDRFRDRVNCGAGRHDRVRADTFDRVRNCETVLHYVSVTLGRAGCAGGPPRSRLPAKSRFLCAEPPGVCGTWGGPSRPSPSLGNDVDTAGQWILIGLAIVIPLAVAAALLRTASAVAHGLLS